MTEGRGGEEGGGAAQDGANTKPQVGGKWNKRGLIEKIKWKEEPRKGCEGRRLGSEMALRVGRRASFTLLVLSLLHPLAASVRGDDGIGMLLEGRRNQLRLPPIEKAQGSLSASFVSAGQR